MRDKEKGF